ncbi:hypothetical protein [Kribbella steppae]|uniref:hypothetical protein n=1 Tax=Kribbella steppae TaxID=2512223 RepID=UPI0010466DC1
MGAVGRRPQERRFDYETLVALGLGQSDQDGCVGRPVPGSDRVPAWDCRQQPVGFVGRSCGGWTKYPNSPTTPIWQKSHTLVGLAE